MNNEKGCKNAFYTVSCIGTILQKTVCDLYLGHHLLAFTSIFQFSCLCLCGCLEPINTCSGEVLLCRSSMLQEMQTQPELGGLVLQVSNASVITLRLKTIAWGDSNHSNFCSANAAEFWLAASSVGSRF